MLTNHEAVLAVSFVYEQDIAKFVIKAVDDPRTLNKVLCIRPKLNFLSPKHVVSLWEQKLGHTLEKTYLSAEDMLKKIAGEQVGCVSFKALPRSLHLAFTTY